MDNGGVDWYTFLTNLNHTDRVSLDLAYLFHLIPTEDRDAIQLFYNTHTKMHAEKTYDPAEVEDFNFTAAIDFAMEVCTTSRATSTTLR